MYRKVARLAKGNPVIGRAFIVARSTHPPPSFSTPRKIFSRERRKGSRFGAENIGEKDERHFEMIGDESSNGIVDAIVRVDPRLDPRFLEEGEETREGEGKFLFELQLDKTFSFLSRGPGLSVGLSRRAAKRA